MKKEHPEFRLTDMVRSLDPTRLINSVTGWHDYGAGDFHVSSSRRLSYLHMLTPSNQDNHHYSSPQCGSPFYSIQSTPYDPKRIGIQGEFGGIGLNVSDEKYVHYLIVLIRANMRNSAWKVKASIDAVNQTYELSADLDTWNYRAHDLFRQLRDQVEMYACSGAVWTQTTDVEGEVNGMLSYDRRINRMDKDQWKKDIQSLYDAAAARGGSNSTAMLMPRVEQFDAT